MKNTCVECGLPCRHARCAYCNKLEARKAKRAELPRHKRVLVQDLPIPYTLTDDALRALQT